MALVCNTAGSARLGRASDPTLTREPTSNAARHRPCKRQYTACAPTWTIPDEPDEHLRPALHARGVDLRALGPRARDRRRHLRGRGGAPRVLGGEVPREAQRRRTRARAGLRKPPGGAGLDHHSGDHRPGPFPCLRARRLRRPGRAAHQGLAGGDRRRSPVLVGVPISGPEDRHRERASRSRGYADVSQPALRRHGSQLLGAATRREDRPDPEPPERDLDRASRDGSLSRPVRTILRNTAREDAPARVCRFARGLRPLGPRAGRGAEGRRVFEQTACINCHTVSGTAANGRFGPDLTHLMSRGTLGAGVASNTPENLRAWIRRPDDFKPGSLMPPMGLSESQLDAVTAYLSTLQ